MQLLNLKVLMKRLLLRFNLMQKV